MFLRVMLYCNTPASRFAFLLVASPRHEQVVSSPMEEPAKASHVQASDATSAARAAVPDVEPPGHAPSPSRTRSH
jgi:hypothetical protein